MFARSGKRAFLTSPPSSLIGVRYTVSWSKAGKKGSAILPFFANFGWLGRQIGKMPSSLTGCGFRPHVQDVYVLWHDFRIWKGGNPRICDIFYPPPFTFSARPAPRER